ncbi:hypothetical protein Agub_g2572 [Astrephomene gubernaculifera]|uniref:Uncharacterized protein n=1 Tax=Astrephomene gubernaculifera TaxID=47775 RepID=A0AAD3DH98_9CHLO|nr:hypothetical protein Agub_g2572 [Astrephomene gubernaculifera]
MAFTRITTCTRPRKPMKLNVAVLALTLILGCISTSAATPFDHSSIHLRRLHRARLAKEGATAKRLYCKQSGGCSQCKEDEEIERYCADTGFKEELLCTTSSKLAEDMPVVLTYPYPSDVHIDDNRNDASSSSSSSAAASIRVVRGCSESDGTRAAHAAVGALLGEGTAAMALGRMGLFQFELVMCLLLGMSLPVVYWRKIRIRHL